MTVFCRPNDKIFNQCALTAQAYLSILSLKAFESKLLSRVESRTKRDKLEGSNSNPNLISTQISGLIHG